MPPSNRTSSWETTSLCLWSAGGRAGIVPITWQVSNNTVMYIGIVNHSPPDYRNQDQACKEQSLSLQHKLIVGFNS